MQEKPQKRILVIGSFITDLGFRVDRYPEEGETLIGHSFQRFPGGKGANQAMAAARLGARVAMVGRLGVDEFGDEQVAGFEAAGIDTSGILRDSEAPSGVATVTIDRTGKNRIVIVPGANMRCSVDDVDAVRDRIAEADVLMLQLEIPLETVARAVDVAAEVGTPVILNPAPARPVDQAVLAKVTYLTPNEVEAEQLTGIPVKSAEQAQQAARKLLSYGVRGVVITLGERGALVLEQDGARPESIPAYPVEAVDTVAAGDAFNGALAVRLAEGASLVEAARYAGRGGARRFGDGAAGRLGHRPLQQRRDRRAFGIPRHRAGYGRADHRDHRQAGVLARQDGRRDPRFGRGTGSRPA